MAQGVWGRIGQGLLRAAVRAGQSEVRRRTRQAPPPGPRRPSGGTRRATRRTPTSARGGYPGDFRGTSTVLYSPDPDGRADPGEVVWAWVPYEEDATRGKDRPVLVVGLDGQSLLGLMLTSRDHDRDGRDDGRHWHDVGTGAWDPQRRPSEVRLDRVVRIDPAAVRREGATLDRARYDEVAELLRRRHGWS